MDVSVGGWLESNLSCDGTIRTRDLGKETTHFVLFGWEWHQSNTVIGNFDVRPTVVQNEISDKLLNRDNSIVQVLSSARALTGSYERCSVEDGTGIVVG